MKSYNHAFDIAFEVISNDENGENITPGQFRNAINRRLALLNDDELLEAIGAPFDSYECSKDYPISKNK